MPEVLGTSKSVYDFDPLSVPGCGLWLDASDSNTLFSDTAGTKRATVSGTIALWKDKSGNGLNYSQSSSGNRPTYSEAGSVRFDNTTFLVNSNTWSGWKWDVFCVTTPWPASYVNTWRTLLRAAGGGHFVIVEAGSERFGYYGTDGFQQFGSATLPSTSRSLIYVSTNSSRVSTGSVNGATPATAPGTQYAPGEGMLFYWLGALGDSQPWGTVNELLIFANVTDVQRQQIEGYLAWKWGIENIPVPAVVGGVQPLQALTNGPLDIPGCALWLDAADTSTLTRSGSKVTQWNDKSGSGNNFVPASASSIPVVATGGTITDVNGYRFHTFTTNGTFTLTTPSSTSVEVLVVGGGGAGGGQSYVGGGGGAGGAVLTSLSVSGSTSVVVGAGGITSLNGQSSSFGSLSVVGGGYGGSFYTPTYTGGNGGCGGGGNARGSSAGGIGSVGYNGGQGQGGGGAGGGGMGGVGADGNAGNGGLGGTFVIGGVSYFLAGGGGGGRQNAGETAPGSAGGGAGGLFQQEGQPAVANTGSGGGGTSTGGYGGSGGSGIVIIAYVFYPGTPTAITDMGRPVVNFQEGVIMSSINQILVTASTAFYTVFRITALSGQGIDYVLGLTNTYGTQSGDCGYRFVGEGLIGSGSITGGIQDLGNSNYYVNGTFNPSFSLSTYSNSYAIVGNTASSMNTTTYLTISTAFSGPRAFIGNISEVLYYPNGLSTVQRQQLEGYLGQKWGITVVTPGSINSLSLWLDGADPTTMSFGAVPTSYFPFNGTIIDQSNVITLRKTGSVPYAPGKYNQAVSFTNASGAYSSNYLSTSYNLPSTFSVSFWFQTPDAGPKAQIFCTAPNSGYSYGGICVYLTSGYLFHAYTHIQNGGVVSTISPNTWYHVVMTYSNGTCLAYVNGSVGGSPVTASGSSINGFTIGGGADIGFDPYPFTGYVDEFCTYTSVLTSTQISNMYSQKVVSWRDKSGYGSNAIQTTLANSPTASGSGVTFNASSNQFMTLNVPYTSSHTIFIVATPTSASQVYLFGRGSGVTGSAPTMILNYNGTQLQYFPASDGSTTSSYGSPTSTFIASYVRNYGTSVIGTLNGAQVFTSVSPTSEPHPTVAWSHLGQAGTGAGYYTGTIYEFMIYGTALTTSQRQTVEAYLSTKWGVPLNGGFTPLLSSPLNIPGCTLWLDGADSNTMTFSSGSNIATWRDKASGLYASNTTIGYQPSYAPASQNNLGTVFFDATAALKFIDIPPFSWGTTTRSCFFVMKNLASGANSGGFAQYPHWFWDRVNGNDPNVWTLIGWTNIRAGGDNAQYIFPLNQYVIYELVYSNSTITQYQSGTQTQSYSTYSSFYDATNGYKLGGLPPDRDEVAYRFYGNIAEVLLFNTAVNNTQRKSIERYLSTKWGISNSYTSIPGSIDGLELWLDAADSTTVTGTTTMTAWNDKSTNGYMANSFSNSVGAPSWVSNAPTVGTAIQYSVGNGSSIANFVLSQTMSIFEVYYPINQSTGSPFLEHGPDENYNSGFYFHAQTNNNFAINSGSGQIAVNFGNVAVTNTWQLIEGINPDPANSSTMAFYVNGQVKASGATQSGTTPVTRTLFINGRNGANSISYNTYLAELIIFSKALTTSQRRAIESYLARKWNIPVPTEALPVTHPFTSIKPFARQFNPVDMPNCKIWLDGADQGSMTFSSGNVSTWLDKSGLGNTATSSASAITVSSNGLYLGGSSYMSVPGLAGTIANTPFVIFIVETLGSAGYYFGDDTVSGNDASLHTGYRYENWQTFAFYADDLENNSGLSGRGNRRIWSLWLPSGSNRQTRRNGTVDVTHGNSNYLTQFVSPVIGRVFGGNWYTGTISELIIYTGAVSLEQIQRVEGYLGWKWNVTLSSSHPFYKFPSSSVIPFLPTNITNCALWLDASGPTEYNKFSFISGSNVRIWYDKSGSNNHAVASAGAYPTYSYESNCVVWNGTASSQLVLDPNISNAVVNKAFTIFVVSQRTTSIENFFMRGTNFATNSNLLIGHGSSTGYTIRFAFYANDLDYNGVPSYTSGEPPSIISFHYSKPNRAIYYNGTLGSSDTNSTDLASWTGAMIGGGAGTWYAYQGKIFEIIIYGAVLTTSQRQMVEGYLAHKWRI